MNHDQSNSAKKNSSSLKWRLQYGRRPPKKTTEERGQEQAMIEQFLATKVDEEPIERKEVEKKFAVPSSKDRKLITKFLEKRVQNLS